MSAPLFSDNKHNYILVRHENRLPNFNLTPDVANSCRSGNIRTRTGYSSQIIQLLEAAMNPPSKAPVEEDSP